MDSNTSCAICCEDTATTSPCCSKPLCENCWKKTVTTQMASVLTGQLICPQCRQSTDRNRLPIDIQTYLQDIRSTIPIIKYPQSISDFNYFFDQSNILRHRNTKEKFVFLTNRHYNRLGDCVNTYIQTLIKSETWKYREIWLPFRENDNDDHHDQVNVFVSDDFETNTNGCLILIQGSGAVRAGQWARSCCINDSLDIGAMFPYMSQAKKHHLSVIILNPNQTTYVENDKSTVDNSTDEDLLAFYLSPERFESASSPSKRIPELSTNRQHVLYVYDHLIAKRCPAERLYVVAHSAGGDGLMHLLRERSDSIFDRLYKIAFTDSVHSLLPSESNRIKEFFKQNAMHFVASDKPMGTPIEYDDRYYSRPPACREVSAGHNRHEYTSGFCVDGVFDFFFPPPSEVNEKTEQIEEKKTESDPVA